MGVGELLPASEYFTVHPELLNRCRIDLKRLLSQSKLGTTFLYIATCTGTRSRPTDGGFDPPEEPSRLEGGVRRLSDDASPHACSAPPFT